jgi:hypothetical protein
MTMTPPDKSPQPAAVPSVRSFTAKPDGASVPRQVGGGLASHFRTRL